MRRTTFMGLILLALLVGLAGCGGDDGGEATTPAGGQGGEAEASIEAPEKIASAGKIVYCTDPTYPVAEFREGSELKGFDIEIGEEIAKRMGVQAEWTFVGFDAIIPAVGAGRCDAILSALSRTPEREKQIDYVSYSEVGQGLMVQDGNPENIQSFEDVSGHSVSVLVGSTNKAALDELNKQFADEGKEPAKIVVFPRDSDAANALRTGQVDVYASDLTSVAFYVQNSPDAFDIIDDQIKVDPYGIGLKKGDRELQTALQQAVDAMYEDGTMQKILEKWGVGETALQ